MSPIVVHRTLLFNLKCILNSHNHELDIVLSIFLPTILNEYGWFSLPNEASPLIRSLLLNGMEWLTTMDLIFSNIVKIKDVFLIII